MQLTPTMFFLYTTKDILHNKTSNHALSSSPTVIRKGTSTKFEEQVGIERVLQQ